jgi:hypothetical protein
MTREDALEQFENWYSACIESGISPEDVISLVGEMLLITDQHIIDQIKDSGII